MALSLNRIRNWLYSPKAQEWLIVVAAYLIAMLILVGSVQFVKGLFAGLPLPMDLGLPKIETTVAGGAVTATTTGQVLFVEAVGRVVNVAKLALQIACVIYIIWIGTEFIINLSNDEVLKKKQNQLLYGLLGFVVLNIGDLVIAIFAPAGSATTAAGLTGGNFVAPTLLTTGWLSLIDLILTIIKAAIGIVSVLVLVSTGYKMISAQEKSIEKEKKHILWVAVGLMFVLIAHLIQRSFLSPDMVGFFTGTTGGSFWDNAFSSGNSLILTIARLILFMMVPVGFFFLILASVYLLTSNGDPARVKKAKNIFLGTVVAMLMAYSAYAVIAEVIVNIIPK